VTEREIIICRDADELSRHAAEQFVELATAAATKQRRFSAALSGGSTPKSLYSLLATAEFSRRILWSQVHLFWGDERCVAPDHAESNFRMVREALVSKIDIPAANIHRMTGEKEPQIAAADYEEQLKQFFHLDNDALPQFDLVLLGLGEDGHTASLFPSSPALNETRRLVATAYVEQLQAHRLTLTLPVINNAAQITFLIAGQSKSVVVGQILAGENSNLPAARIQPVTGRLTWLITQDAAGKTSEQ
jgi:6-phosphogluconolactonase